MVSEFRCPIGKSVVQWGAVGPGSMIV